MVVPFGLSYAFRACACCFILVLTGCTSASVAPSRQSTRTNPRDGAAPDGGRVVGDASVPGDIQPPECVKDCVEMIHIPAGTFQMGASDVPGESKPMHEVTLTRGFWIDKYEVSQKRFDACVQDGVCVVPSVEETYDRNNPRAMRAVDWPLAKKYCEWTGKRLPTEAEWERAACGEGTQCYPWGGSKNGGSCSEQPTCEQAAFCPESLCAGDGPCSYPVDNGNPRPQDVAKFEAAGNVSPYGVVSMAGNVWEWVADPYTDNFNWCSPSCVDPFPPQSAVNSSKHKGHVMKGGSWISEEVFLRCAARFWDESAGGFGTFETGIRCAIDE